MADEYKPQDTKERGSLWKRFPLTFNLLLMAVVIPLLVWLMLLFVDFWTHHGETATVPDVRGMSFERALTTLEEAGLDVVISDSIDNPGNLVGGTIIDIMPKPGSVVKGGREVYLTVVSYTPFEVTITEPLANRDLRSVMNYLRNLGFDTAKVLVKNVPWMYPGSVVAVHVGNRTLDIGSRLRVNERVTIELGVEDTLFMQSQPDFVIVDSLLNASEPASTPSYSSHSSGGGSSEPAPEPVEPAPADPENPLYD